MQWPKGPRCAGVALCALHEMQVVCGGRRHGGTERKGKSGGGKGSFFEPTVLAGVTHEMHIANQEAFGPVMTIVKFQSEQEVVRGWVQAGCGSHPSPRGR